MDIGLLENKGKERRGSLESQCSEWGRCQQAALPGTSAAGLCASSDLTLSSAELCQLGRRWQRQVLQSLEELS